MVDPQPSQARAPQARVASVLEDPSAEAIARTYAESFLNVAATQDVDSALEEFDSFITDVLHPNPEFEAVLVSELVGRDQKVALIDRVIAPVASPLFTNFLRVLALHDRLDLLPLILKQVQKKNETRMGRQRVQVKSARPLSDAELEKIRGQLAASLPFQPIIEAQTDPSLLGGLVIRVGDTVYDSSLRARLKQLRTRLRQRSLHEIQSGRDRFSHPEGD